MDVQTSVVGSLAAIVGTGAVPAETPDFIHTNPNAVMAESRSSLCFDELGKDELPGGAKWADICSAWLKSLQADSQANIYLHPDLVFANFRDKAAPIILAGRMPGGDIQSFAVLRADDRRVRIIPRLPLHLTLRRRKLANSFAVGIRDARDAEALVTVMVNVLKSGRADELLFDDLEVDSPLWKALIRVNEPNVHVTYPSAAQPHRRIEFPEKAEDYWKSLSSHDRKNLKSRAKKLEHSIRCYRKPEEVAEFLTSAHSVSKNTWQTKSQRPQILNTPGELKYWQTVASHGAMRSYILHHKGAPAAFMLGVQCSDRFVSEEMGYDPVIADMAPGTVLTFRIIEDLLANDAPRMWDFGYGDNQYKRIVATHETTSGPISLMRRALRPMAAVRLIEVRQRIAKHARACIDRLGLTTEARRLYRRSAKAEKPPIN